MEPGLHKGQPMAAYLGLDAVSCSLLRGFRKTPAHARQAMLAPREDTPALILGEATHYSILEPALFDSRYGVIPKGDHRTNVWKAAMAEWEAEHPNVVPLRPEEYWACKAMGDAVLSHPIAGQLVTLEGLTEVVAVWTDPVTGLLCKARPDRIVTYEGWTTVVNLKTCRDASEYGFSRAVYEYGYHNGKAWYLDGLNETPINGKTVPRDRRYLHIAVESEPPYAVAVYEIIAEAVEQGRQDNRAWLTRYKKCLDTNEWPGYPVEILNLDIPRWAHKPAEEIAA